MNLIVLFQACLIPMIYVYSRLCASSAHSNECIQMNVFKSNTDFLFDLYQFIPPAHIALFLRLIRLYPLNIVDNHMKREQTILAIVNETCSSNYKGNIWASIMSISRIPKLVEQLLLINENERLLLAIEKLQLRFELQPHRFLIHQLTPTATTCVACQSQLQEPQFDEINTIIGRDNVYSCVMYKIECCDLVYKYGHVRNRRTRERFVTSAAVFSQEFLHLFDDAIYERRLVGTFTNLVYEAATSFQSYTNATNLDIHQNRNFKSQSPIKNKLSSKTFSVTWTWFEICIYLFFMTDLTIIQIPDITQRVSHDLYYEVNATFFYELFIKFWSHHNQVQGCLCRSKNQCMLNFVFDTHMKAHRLVCAYTSSCDESIPELGPVAIGCPRMPLRSSSIILKNMTSKNVSIFSLISRCSYPSEAEKDKCKQYCALHYKHALVLDMARNLHIEKAVELDKLSDEFDGNDICTVHRDNDDTEHKRRTAGFMAIMSNCNVIIGWSESVRAEGMGRSIYQLLKILHLKGKLPPAAAYDSACTFVAYLKNQYGVSIKPSPYVDEIMRKRYCIDRFHRRNHVRPECKTTLSCESQENKPFFDKQNTQVCEQLFAHFTKIKSTLRSINWPYSTIFYCIIFHLRNCVHTNIYPDNPYLAKKSNIEPPINSLHQWTEVMASRVDTPLENETKEQSDTESEENV